MTEKEKAIEDETIELPTGPAEKKKPHRGRIVVITVAALALSVVSWMWSPTTWPTSPRPCATVWR